VKRAARAGLAALLLSPGFALSCAQTDLVALDALEPGCSDAAACAAPLCAAHSCEPGSSQAAFCMAQSNLFEIGDGCSAQTPDIQSFRFAICSCTDLVTVAALRVDGPDSTALAVNGALRVKDGVDIQGSVRVGAALASSGQLPPMITGPVIEHAPPACVCDATTLLDIGAAVRAHARDNDNAASQLASTELDAFSSQRELDLNCGRYYLSRIAGSAALHMRVHGRVALFVAGNIELDDAWVVNLDAGAQLELLVAGNLRVAGRVELLSETASDLRVLVGGEGTLDLSSDTSISGVLYAPRAELVTRGRFEIDGALFVRRAAPGAELVVHYPASLADSAAFSCGEP
jgi:hypothetical protein